LICSQSIAQAIEQSNTWQKNKYCKPIGLQYLFFRRRINDLKSRQQAAHHRRWIKGI